ncbi:ATP-binding protein [Bacteroidetes bacterium UKL13-3]|jgi:ATP-binding protein involved in chromosome partitioning|nr:ATP-binding protein [Bacteroidetes bacterium UKL13-3]HCP93363.1 MRP family ATP-binding protein [Bacteroidota bacterium]
MITQQDILKALSTVQEPDLRKDLVTLNMIKDIVINDNNVTFTVVLTTPACPLKEKIETDCINAIHELVSPSLHVKVEMRANVTSNRMDKLVLPGVKNIIAVVSGKGGVGKSTVSANLALALHQLGAKVGLLDADIHGPSVPMMFGVHDETPDMRDVNGKQLMVPIERHGIKLLSIGFMIDPNQAVVWRGPMISSALRQFVNDTDWGELDYLILDMPPGTGDIHLTMAQIVPVSGVVLVTTPQDVALADAMKAAVMFEMLPTKIPMLGVVENMSWFTPAELPDAKYYIFGQGGGQKMADKIGVGLLGQVPLVQGVREGGDTGMPAVLDDMNPAKEVFLTIAKQVAQQLAIINSAKVVTA